MHKRKNLIQSKIIKKFREINDPPNKLIEHLKSLNTAYKNKHYINCSIIIRAILDYIPPFFGFEKISALLFQFKGKRTFRSALDGLNVAIRNIADDALHNPACKGEIIKVTKQTIDNQQGNLKIVIEHILKQVLIKDLRKDVKQFSRENTLEKKKKNNIQMFEHYIEHGKWYTEFIENREVRICEEDNLYQIHSNGDYKDFTEPWTQVYPDKLGSAQHSIDLVYNNNILKRLTFVYCDGGRISVALPQIETDDNHNKNVHYFWRKESLDFKLTKLIGSFYTHRNIEGIAHMSKIEIR